MFYPFQSNDHIPFAVSEIQSQASDSKMDSKLCPCNPNLAAFIHRNDIWVTNLETGEERRLTHANNGSTIVLEEPVSAGVASFIVQEEFDRYTGYWWQPKYVLEDSKYHVYMCIRCNKSEWFCQGSISFKWLDGCSQQYLSCDKH